MKELIKLVDEKLDEYLQIEYPEDIFKSMKYTLMLPGKRLRPVMCLETVRMLGGDIEVALPTACAIEMLHVQSLIHDDLPCMDNDDFRRGKPSNHKVFGEANAVLAGDALLNYAFETAAKAFSMYPTKALEIGKALQVLAGKAGIYGMIGGQVVDVESAGNAVSKEVLDFIYELKTSALIESSMMIGAILAGADEQAIKDIETIAKNVGIAFQIQDDILDVTSTAEVLGKPILSDEKNEKTTYVTLVGLEKAKEYVEKISLEAIELLHRFEAKDLFLEELLKSLIHREK